MSKKRTRLTNEEKSIGITIKEKKEGMTVSKKKKELNKSQKPKSTPITSEELEAKYNNSKSIGLGDAVEEVATFIGVKSLVKKFTPDGKDCGCDRRKEKLNSIFRGSKPLCLDVDEYEFLSDFFSVDRRGASAIQVRSLKNIYGRIFSVNISSIGSCDGCIREVVKKLKKVYRAYE